MNTFVVLVEDHPGVLTRVSGLIRRRGFNIDSITVGHTETAGVSRMTIAVEADEVTATSFVDTYGDSKLIFSTDYPHGDGTWPDTQAVLHEQIGHFPADEVRKLTWENASRLFRFPVPEAVQADPDAF